MRMSLERAVPRAVPLTDANSSQDRRRDAGEPEEHQLRRFGQGVRALLRPAKNQSWIALGVPDPVAPGDPRVNIQNDKGKAKPYQVRQVLAAIDKKEAEL
jgi:hypothetical protein